MSELLILRVLTVVLVMSLIPLTVAMNNLGNQNRILRSQLHNLMVK